MAAKFSIAIAAFALSLLIFSPLLIPNYCYSHEYPVMLHFEQVYDHLQGNALEVQAATTEVSARSSDVYQAAAYPNPELSVELDTIGRSVHDDGNELTIAIGQLIELGGKRSARIRVADAIQCTAAWELEIAKNELYATIRNAFIDFSVAKEKAALAEAQYEIATQTLECAKATCDAGKASPLESKKAEVIWHTSKLQYAKQTKLATKAKKALLALWNDTPPAFENVNFALYNIAAPTNYQQLADRLADNPTYGKAQSEAYRAWEVIDLERAQSIPDLSVLAGVTADGFYQEAALNLGFNIALPIFDQNKGNIARAIHEYNQAFYHQLKVAKELKITLTVVHDEWLAAYEQATTLRNQILPSAEEAFQLAQTGYKEGKFDYLHLLDAGSSLFEVKKQYLDAIEEYHKKNVEIIKLTGAKE